MCREHGLAWLYLEVAWLGIALCAGSMAWHGFSWRLHGLARINLEVAWLGLAWL